MGFFAKARALIFLSAENNHNFFFVLTYRQSMQISMDVLVDHHIGLFEHVRFGYWALSATGMVGRFPRIHQFVLCCTFHLWDVFEDVQSWLSSKLMNDEFFRPLWVDNFENQKKCKKYWKICFLMIIWLRLYLRLLFKITHSVQQSCII